MLPSEKKLKRKLLTPDAAGRTGGQGYQLYALSTILRMTGAYHKEPTFSPRAELESCE